MNIYQWTKRPNKLDFNAAKIQIWIARLDNQRVSDYWAYLSDDERTRANRIKNPGWASRYVIARGILRCLLSAYLDLTPRDFVFQYGRYGKPALSRRSDNSLSFNLAHSEDLAVYGFVEGQQIGVDVEKIRPLKDIDSIAAITMSPAECSVLLASTGFEKLQLFYMLWTCKEALIKMNGNGLYQNMKSININCAKLDLDSLDAIISDVSQKRVCTFTPAKGYISSIAI